MVYVRSMPGHAVDPAAKVVRHCPINQTATPIKTMNLNTETQPSCSHTRLLDGFSSIWVFLIVCTYMPPPGPPWDLLDLFVLEWCKFK